MREATLADDEHPPDSLRIACLIPSATDMCRALGLSRYLVGITHECEPPPPDGDGRTIRVLTEDKLPNTLSQGEIHEIVQENSSQHAAAAAACQRKQDGAEVETMPPSLYPINRRAFQEAAPTLIITQDLCNVCAPSSSSVEQALQSIQQEQKQDSSPSTPNGPRRPKIVSLSPHSLHDVLENIETVAAACGVRQRGLRLRQTLQERLSQVRQITQQCKGETNNPTRALLLEWLDPPFDGGHWIPDMMHYAGLEMADVGAAEASSAWKKSSQLTWDQVEKSDPDAVVVACCGFDLDRNHSDAVRAQSTLATLRASQQNNVWAVHGDLYFARPGPYLVEGVVILALCAHQNTGSEVAQALRKLDWIDWTAMEAAYRRVQFDDPAALGSSIEPPVVDVEDYATVHDRACANRESFYADPETGYQVFTEYAHVQRGKCCGSGCRHCPYGHENLKDKVGKIQQPAILTGDDESDALVLLSPQQHSHSKVLFFSGGKDSFLAIRAVVKQAQELAVSSSPSKGESFGLVLLTTFDATSRMIAHQEMPVATAVRQAQHLGLTLVGVPMHRASSESYVDRVRRALDLLEGKHNIRVTSLVFGDLHLAHVVEWRKQNMPKLGPYRLEFPLYQASYNSLLQDLHDSGVKCVVTASTVDESVVQAGDTYDNDLRRRLAGASMDVFGENGEFHTEAQVWTVPRNRALGLAQDESE